MRGTFDRMLSANADFVSTFEDGDLPAPPALKMAIITCMDARMQPEKFLGLRPGDAHVIRNAGGRASEDAIRSLVISQRLLGTEEIVVIHHTQCGMSTFTNEELVSQIREDLGAEVPEIEFLPFADEKESVREDVETLRRSELIPNHVRISAAIYDLRTGRVSEVIR